LRDSAQARLHKSQNGRGYTNIIKHTQRPFVDADEMDRVLIANWNAVVAPADEVWVLGDFCFRSATDASSYLSRLHGSKHLVSGNHDSPEMRNAKGWASVRDYGEVSVDGTKIVLSHYGMRVWNGSHRGSVHLYGHSHGQLPGFQTPSGGGCLDVGVDGWYYAPVRWADVKRQLETLPVVQQEEYEGDED
jgi:calcineurin-like phosphoesterase family protein